jgi:hypothetical protein
MATKNISLPMWPREDLSGASTRISDGRCRHALYALPGEVWRIDAYIAMWKQAAESGWSEELERLEGHLLGYEDWQNDLNIATLPPDASAEMSVSATSR